MAGRKTASSGEYAPTRREIFRLAACALLNVACNSLAPFVAPLFAVLCAGGGIVCWILSLNETSAIRIYLSRNRAAAIAVGVLLAGLLVFTVSTSYKSAKREWGPTPCRDAGPAFAGGDGSIAVSGCGNDLSGTKTK